MEPWLNAQGETKHTMTDIQYKKHGPSTSMCMMEMTYCIEMQKTLKCSTSWIDIVENI